jgi:hypothetical protein
METTAQLTPAEIEDLQTSFAVCDPIQFARHLHTLDIPDAIKGQWLRLKVQQKPTERGDAMQKAIERAMSNFWNRLSERADV